MLDTPHALVVCPELPGGAAAGIEALVIRHNTIRNGGWFCAAPWSSQAGIISITSTEGSSELRTTPVFKNLRVEENTVEGGAGPHLVLSSAEGVLVRDNHFISAQHDEPPATGASYKIPKDAIVWIARCSDVSYDGNGIENTGTFAGRPVQIEK
ncbi:MAG: hypothetical protein ACO1TE_10305 [Prosthecobacter sp.]